MTSSAVSFDASIMHSGAVPSIKLHLHSCQLRGLRHQHAQCLHFNGQRHRVQCGSSILFRCCAAGRRWMSCEGQEEPPSEYDMTDGIDSPLWGGALSTYCLQDLYVLEAEIWSFAEVGWPFHQSISRWQRNLCIGTKTHCFLKGDEFRRSSEWFHEPAEVSSLMACRVSGSPALPNIDPSACDTFSGDHALLTSHVRDLHGRSVVTVNALYM